MKNMMSTQSMMNDTMSNPFVQSSGFAFGQQYSNPFASASPQPASRLIYSTDKKSSAALDLETE